MTPAAQLRSVRHASCKGEGKSTSFKLPCSVLFAHQQCNFILNPFLGALLQTKLAFTVILQARPFRMCISVSTPGVGHLGKGCFNLKLCCISDLNWCCSFSCTPFGFQQLFIVSLLDSKKWHNCLFVLKGGGWQNVVLCYCWSHWLCCTFSHYSCFCFLVLKGFT